MRGYSVLSQEFQDPMYLKSITLKNFRNYDHLQFEPKRGLNVLLGKNAQGKTNLLEALNILASSKSFRVRREEDLIMWGCDHAEIKADFINTHNEERSLIIRWALNPITHNWDRRILINNQIIKRLGDFLGEIPLVLFVPGDLALIQGAPELRRRLLDVLLCKIYQKYYTCLVNFQKVLRQYNKFLHDAIKNGTIENCIEGSDRGYLEIWNKQLIKYGSQIIYCRLIVMVYLEPVVSQVYAQLSEAKQDVLKLKYVSSLNNFGLKSIGKSIKSALLEQSTEVNGQLGSNLNIDELIQENVLGEIEKVYAEALCRNLHSKNLGHSFITTGPHRDDFGIDSFGYNLKIFGSQGQHRSTALALRLAEAKFMSLAAGEESIILLDDCFSELDRSRSKLLLSYLSGLGQVFLTAANTLEFSEPFTYSPDFGFFKVSAGQIEPVSHT